MIHTYQIDLLYNCNLQCKQCYAKKINSVMSKQILFKSIQYICKNINKNLENQPTIAFSGGEVSLYNQQYILQAVHYIKQNCNKTPKIGIQSNISYSFTKQNLNLFKQLNFVNTSYDYNIRWNTIENKINFFKNLQILKKLNINVQIVICISSKLIHYVSPEMLFDFILSTNIKQIDLKRLLFPLNNKNDFINILPKNQQVRNYLYQCFLIYQKIKKYYSLNIQLFENIIKSYFGIFFGQLSRNCCSSMLTFQPNGKISTCVMKPDIQIFDLNTMYQNKINLKFLTQNQKKIQYNKCINCQYLKYCQGDCHLYKHDQTGCLMPYKIYQYLKLKNGL